MQQYLKENAIAETFIIYKAYIIQKEGKIKEPQKQSKTSA